LLKSVWLEAKELNFCMKMPVLYDIFPDDITRRFLPGTTFSRKTIARNVIFLECHLDGMIFSRKKFARTPCFSGKCFPGQFQFGQMPSGQMSSGQMTCGQMSSEQMSSRQMLLRANVTPGKCLPGKFHRTENALLSNLRMSMLGF
jgi:hypothetical protein